MSLKTERRTAEKPVPIVYRVFLGISMPLLIISVIFFSIMLCADDENWVRKEYEKLDLASRIGMNTDDICLAFRCMVDYMEGKRDDLSLTVEYYGKETEMFNGREISHMQDVRRLYRSVEIFSIASAVAAAAGIALGFAVERKAALARLRKYYLTAFICVFLFAAVIGIWAAIDFNSLWYAFHYVFLDVESSTFDLTASRMIRICPSVLFRDMVKRIIVTALSVLLILGAVLIIANDPRSEKAAIGIKRRK